MKTFSYAPNGRPNGGLRVLRGLAGVVAGFAISIALIAACEWMAVNTFGAKTVDSNYMLASLAWTVIAAALGGFVAARIAGTRELPWSAGVGFLLVMLSVIAMGRRGTAQPGWYETAVAGCGPISALIGGAIRLLTKRKKNETLPASQAERNRRSA